MLILCPLAGGQVYEGLGVTDTSGGVVKGITQQPLVDIRKKGTARIPHSSPDGGAGAEQSGMLPKKTLLVWRWPPRVTWGVDGFASRAVETAGSDSLASRAGEAAAGKAWPWRCWR